MTITDRILAIQAELGVEVDGFIGPETVRAIYERLVGGPPAFGHSVKASSFADPADVAAFRRCKAAGGTDSECFAKGDNGVGLWNDDTTADVPMCALPYEDWQERWQTSARGKRVVVKANGAEIICELRDTMPHRSKIRNGAGIDLNPAACAALGLKPPILVPAVWYWEADIPAVV